MRSPLAAWKSGTRWPLATLFVLGAIVVAILICEAIGWPFLVGPVQRTLARTLDREVAFGTSDDRGVRIGLLGSVSVRAARIEIGAPAWSKEPHMLLAENAYLKLGYLDLWRAYRGRSLHIDRLEAGTLDVALERTADGKASWQFGDKAAKDDRERPTALPTFGVLEVAQGRVGYRDAITPLEVDAQFTLSEGGRVAAAASGVASAPSEGIAIRAGRPATTAGPGAFVLARPGEPVPKGLQLLATGQWKKSPLRIELQSSGVTTLFGEQATTYAQPVVLVASVGQADLSFRGTATDPIRFRDLKGRFTLDGPTLASAGEPFGITLPATPPFRTRGAIAKDGEVWKAVFDSAEIGSSRLNAALTFDKGRDVPLLSGRIGGSRLVLADLGPAVGAPTGAGTTSVSAPQPQAGRVVPDKTFDLPSLRAMDANVVFDIGFLDLGTPVLQPFRPIRTHLLLSDGVLTLRNIEASTAQGQLAGYLQLDGRGKEALWTADLRLSNVRLEQFLKLERKGDKPAYLSGRFDSQIKVAGRGRSAADILASLDGNVRFRLRDATVSHLIVEAGGIDLAQLLGLVMTKDKPLPIRCNVADLEVDDGVVKPKVFVINTDDSTIWIDGTVALGKERMDLRMVVSPKDFSPLTLRTPVRVGGSFADPSVSIEAGRLVGKAGAAALLALLHPLAALIPFIDPGNKDRAQESDAECAALARTASGRIAAPVRTPGNVRIPDAASAPR